MKKMALLAMLAAAAALPGAARAQSAKDYEPTWDIGLDPGMIYPTGKREYSHTVSNQLVYTLLANETVGDEVAEGFIAPPPNGVSTVSGSNAPMSELAAHVLRRYNDNWWLGVTFGWSGTHNDFVDNPGVYNQAGFTRLGYSTWYLHVAPVARWQRDRGFFRPFVTVGPEISLINEHATAYFTDPDDSVQPVDAFDKTHVFGGAVVGLGYDIMLTQNGSLGVAAEYHKVLSLGPNMDYITPHVNLTVYF
jgi:opacity protein-like surface antigen